MEGSVKFSPEVHEDEDGEEERDDGDGVSEDPDEDLPVGHLSPTVTAGVVQATLVVGIIVPGPIR